MGKRAEECEACRGAGTAAENHRRRTEVMAIPHALRELTRRLRTDVEGKCQQLGTSTQDRVGLRPTASYLRELSSSNQ